VHRQADGARLIHERAINVLADPPGGIGGKAEAALRVEFLEGVHQTQIAFLDQVQQGQTAVQVMLGDVHHQAQVALDHLLACCVVTVAYAPRQRQFLIGRQQRMAADLVKVLLGNIVRHVAERIVHFLCAISRLFSNPHGFMQFFFVVGRIQHFASPC
jgi:hypothetical protein